MREHRNLNRHSQAIASIREKLDGNGGEATGEIVNGPSQEAYENRALPNSYITYDQSIGASKAYEQVKSHGRATGNKFWRLIGPTTGSVPDLTTYTGRSTVASGRITSLAIAPACAPGDCRLWVGAAGGGVWRTDNALDSSPKWTPSSDGIASNAIGSLFVDPTDPKGKTLYAGTGEPNGSSDSEAGVGLYKSTDGGKSWSLVPGSVAAAKDRSIGAIAVDPTNSQHIYIGTAVARHGSSSVNGGRFTPPDAPTVGLYESTDGGASFKLVFSQPADSVNPASPTGSDFFRGGVSKIVFDPTSATSRIYFSMFDYGLYRTAANGSYERVFASAGGGSVGNSAGSRTEFALAPHDGKLRIYLGDTSGVQADFYRVDDAGVPAATLTTGAANPGWTKLSNSANGTPGYASYNYCETQCSYDMFVASPSGQPGNVWLGGSMAYNELFTAHQPSNGRAVQRSTDAGVSFTDMTNDTQSPPLGMHPDQHAIAFDPANPDIAFVGSDGGLVRTDGGFTDTSAACANRGLAGADLVDCQAWLKAVPTRIFSLNDGLATLQFQSVSVNHQDPLNDVIGGTQDNGTWAYTGAASQGSWFESVGGDGGQSGIDAVNPNIRVHSYYAPQHDVNFRKNDPSGWDWISDPLLNSGEAASFYTPIIADPKVGGTLFDGLQHVWRTLDDGGQQAYLDQHCNEFTGDLATTCGDWAPLGGPTLTGSAYGTDKSGSYVVAIARATSDTGTMWVATRRGRVFVSKNADAASASGMVFTRIDTAAQPTRFVSGIAVDPADPNHAFVSFSGYNAYTPNTPGHVFEVRYNPTSGIATWTDLSYDLGDQPITAIARDDASGDLYVATDFGVAKLASGATTWVEAAPGMPLVATYGLTIDSSAHVLYAATHGRGVFHLGLR